MEQDENEKRRILGVELNKAARHGELERVRELIGCNADLDQRFAGLTPLMWAAFRGDVESVQCLIDAGSNIDALDHRGRTALMWAVYRGKTKAIVYLVDCGACLDAEDKNKMTAKIIAEEQENLPIVAYLTERCAVNAAAAEAHQKNIDILKRTPRTKFSLKRK